MWRRKHWIVLVTLLFLAAFFRISVAHWLANDNPDDGRVYAQIARDVLEQHRYSHDAEPPYEPSLIRVPGYPLFIATVYSVFGHTNNGAVRIVQALIDTATCALVSLLAFLWQPDVRRKPTTALISLAFCVVLVPWTIRNWRTFHLFQPLAPAHAEMPNEFIPHGYNRWLKTWLDDPQYIDPLEWELDVEPINIDDLPDSAFDSDEERDRVAALFEKYNHSPAQMSADTSTPPQVQPGPAPQMSPTPKDKAGAAAASPTQQTSASPNTNSNANQAENSSDENSNDESAENEESENESNESKMPHGSVEMTAEIDAGFAQIAAERIARHRFRYYVLLPAKRARALWFNTHSDFYPFEGTLLPLDDLDYEIHQQIWLPLFALLVAIYTIVGIAGGFVLWASRDPYARLWLLLVGLIVLLRLGFLSTLENPEPQIGRASCRERGS